MIEIQLIYIVVTHSQKTILTFSFSRAILIIHYDDKNYALIYVEFLRPYRLFFGFYKNSTYLNYWLLQS